MGREENLEKKVHGRVPGLKYKIHLEFISDPRRQNTGEFQSEDVS
jgi:hypothetical protein